MGKYSNIDWKNQIVKNGIVIQEGTPIPKEIIEYYKRLIIRMCGIKNRLKAT